MTVMLPLGDTRTSPLSQPGTGEFAIDTDTGADESTSLPSRGLLGPQRFPVQHLQGRVQRAVVVAAVVDDASRASIGESIGWEQS